MKMEERHVRRERMGGIFSNECGGGIGTMGQRRAAAARTTDEAMRPGRGGVASAIGRDGASADVVVVDERPSSSRTSLYLTNLPVDGSTNERTLRSLFGSYGRLDRVTMYRSRSTGELKGDGLVVFGRDAVEGHRARRRTETDDGADLVDEVCAQVRGERLFRFIWHGYVPPKNPIVGYLGSVLHSNVDLVD